MTTNYSDEIREYHDNFKQYTSPLYNVMANHPRMTLDFLTRIGQEGQSFADMDIISQSNSHQKIFAMQTFVSSGRFQSNYLIPPEKASL